MVPKRPLRERFRTWRRSLRDPLRGGKAAARWIASLPTADPLQLQHETLDLVASFPGGRRRIGPAQADALLRVDARCEPIISHLTAQYTTNYQRSSSVETRLWHGVFDLVKAFTAAYQAALKAGYAAGEQKRWKTVLPQVLVRLAYYKAIDGKFRLFRYGHWIPAQWRELHELYEFARLRGWQREPLSFGGATFSRPAESLEQEYIRSLLLMRLDSGNFTPDQVEWIARSLEEWTPSLTLTPPPGTGANFYVDLSGTQGLKRQEKARAGGRLMFLDAAAVYAHVVERMRTLPEQDADPHLPGALPPREQKLLLMRLAALYGPDALAFSPRAPRKSTDAEMRVVVGLQALTRAVAEVEHLSAEAKTSGAGHSYDEITELVNPNANPESIARRIRGSPWKMVNRSESGCRMIAPAREAPTKLGEIIAIKDGDRWELAVVRRMQRQQSEEVICGVEIIARRMVRVLLRSWVAPLDAQRAGVDRPFFGIYLPAHADNRQAAQRSLIGPDDRFLPGGMVELDTGNARYLIRFTQTLERQAGWAWALFNAVRKLSP
ncbi:MAG: hypothetical protein AUH79_05940 [Betaproteobacteria bacterium 13_1_40CM_4_64_4]|nr:MAG: hypothetical protein AUH79_05940 [Betaproteobacteria bacterium 13_1_40CM_4_64_4]